MQEPCAVREKILRCGKRVKIWAFKVMRCGMADIHPRCLRKI
jgi:hypothetical protein